MFSSHSCPAIRRPFLRFLLSLQKNHLVHSNTYQNFPQTFIRPVLCLTFVQLRQYRRQHGEKACTAAYKVGNRFRPEHAVCSQAIHMRQQERQRYYDHYLSEQRKKGGLFCLSKCYEHALPGKLQCHKAEAEKVTHTEFLENELNQTYFKDFLSDYKDTVITIHQTWKRVLEIEENQRLLPFDSDEQQELIQLKKKLTVLIDLL